MARWLFAFWLDFFWISYPLFLFDWRSDVYFLFSHIQYIFLAVKIHLLRCLRKCNLTFNLLFQQQGTQQCRHFSFWNPWTRRTQTRKLSISGFHPEKCEYMLICRWVSLSKISVSVFYIFYIGTLFWRFFPSSRR